MEISIYSRIYITGMPGSGKTTIAKKLARHLRLNFVDLDGTIVLKENMAIDNIFHNKGEHYFREAEQRELHETQKLTNVIIACGGGTVAYKDNMDWINKHGLSIYLQAPLTMLESRILGSKTVRPLFKDLEKEDLRKKISLLSEERAPYFLKSDIIIPLPLESLETLAEQVNSLILKQGF